MLRITVEIWPGGHETGARVLAIANVANMSELSDVSDYAITATENDNPLTNIPSWSKRGELLQHRRRTSVWALVAKVAIWAAEQAPKAES